MIRRALPFLLLLPVIFCARAEEKKVILLTIDGSINPSAAQYIHEGIGRAEVRGAAAVLIELNTPGGLLKSTRSIVSDLLSSPIPVIVYVTPRGGQAASAGVFITLAAHIAAMAPGTNIGAAHPVTLEEGGANKKDSSDIMMEKVTNDAAAFIRTIAEKRNRNAAWAEEAVRRSLSITETEAVKLRVVDLAAADVQDLFRRIDGMVVTTARGNDTLRTREWSAERQEMSFAQRLLDLLSDPNIAYILMMIGIYGIFFELYNPGSIFPGVIGGICLILAFYSMQTLPINFAGLALIIFALILFLLEIKIVSHGLLTIGGVIALLLGSLMLIQSDPTYETFRISLSVIIAVTLCTAGFFGFAVGKGISAQRRKPATGAEGIAGESGTVIERLDPEGRISVHGEIWKAVSASGSIDEGERVLVTGVRDLTLTVERPRPAERGA